MLLPLYLWSCSMIKRAWEALTLDNLSKEQRSKCMSHIRSKDTGIEVVLRKALWHKGYRYRKNYKALPGTPDIALTKYKIAVFCDNEFWHGKDWEVLRPKLLKGNNPDYWVKKIERNRDRDSEINRKLMSMDWTVIRFWGSDILKDTDKCVSIIEDVIFETKLNNFDYMPEEDYDS